MFAFEKHDMKTRNSATCQGQGQESPAKSDGNSAWVKIYSTTLPTPDPCLVNTQYKWALSHTATANKDLAPLQHPIPMPKTEGLYSSKCTKTNILAGGGPTRPHGYWPTSSLSWCHATRWIFSIMVLELPLVWAFRTGRLCVGRLYHDLWPPTAQLPGSMDMQTPPPH